MTAVEFGSLKVGAWFKESVEGAWHFKTSTSKATYQSWGTRYEPHFASKETVYVEETAAAVN